MTHGNIPQIKVVAGGIKFCLAVGIDQLGGLCKQRMGCDAGFGQIGIVGYIHPLGHGTLLKYKAGRDGLAISVTVEGKSNGNAGVQTFLDFLNEACFAEILGRIGNLATSGKIIDSANHGYSSHIHRSQFLQLQMPQPCFQQFFQTGILLGFNRHTVNFGDDRRIGKIRIDRNGMQFVFGQCSSNGGKGALGLHSEVLAVFQLNKFPDQPLCFLPVRSFHVEGNIPRRYFRNSSICFLLNCVKVLVIEGIFFQ